MVTNDNKIEDADKKKKKGKIKQGAMHVWEKSNRIPLNSKALKQ
jgi:hypothetical protein